MATVEAGLQSQIRNIEAKHGRTMDGWAALLAGRGLTRHGEMMPTPKKAYLSLRRRKQFALIQPAAAHVDVGLILAGEPAAGRLEPSGNFNSMFTHRVRVPSADAVDAELAGWLRRAYERAG